MWRIFDVNSFVTCMFKFILGYVLRRSKLYFCWFKLNGISTRKPEFKRGPLKWFVLNRLTIKFTPRTSVRRKDKYVTGFFFFCYTIILSKVMVLLDWLLWLETGKWERSVRLSNGKLISLTVTFVTPTWQVETIDELV